MITYDDLMMRVTKKLESNGGYYSTHELVCEVVLNEILKFSSAVEMTSWEVRYTIEVSKPKLPAPYFVSIDITKATDEQLLEEIGKRYAQKSKNLSWS